MTSTSTTALPATTADRAHFRTAGAVRTTLRLEGAAALAAAALAYGWLQGDWALYALLFLVPDLSMLGYLRGRRLGAAVYNAGHSYLGPALLALGARLAGWEPGPLLALVWAAHIGFDRMMGYGLKSPSAFGDTHLGWRGRRPA